jgi:Protein of unknown function (DUF1569)
MADFRRRSVTLGSLADVRQEIDRLDAARQRGSLERRGNWSLDQCCQHLGRWIEFSIDGFPFKYPWRYRLLGRLVCLVSWRWLVKMALRPGFLNPPSAQAVEPDAFIADGQGVTYVVRQISRIEKGERMMQPNPVEGQITHDQWCYFHLRHAELHLSFQIVRAEG